MNKLIKLSENHYIVVNDSEIKEGDIVCEKLLTGKYELFTINTLNDIDVNNQFKITHSTEPVECDKMWTSLNGERWMCNTISCCGKFVNQKIKPLSLSEVEEVINGYRVEKMAEKEIPYQPYDSSLYQGYRKYQLKGYQQGFKAHQELVKDKLFTVQEVRGIFAVGIQLGINQELFTQLGKPLQDEDKVFEKTIHSLLPKTEWEVNITPEGKILLI